MDSPQSVVSPFKSSSGFLAAKKQQIGNALVESSSILLKPQGKEAEEGNSDGFLGALDVYIHQARDIHNICIYQNQDVYAKLSLTTDPEKAVSTKIINRGGRNPVFNEGVRLDACKPDSSLKCEIWMLSRIQNYLKDQLLGFASVPVSEVLLHNSKLEKELSLSSTDLFHSPAGFVRLSISYIGTPPEVIPIPAPVEPDSLTDSAKSVQDDLDKIEFPDPKVVNENQQMVEEYITMPPCANQCSNNLAGSDTETENRVSSEAVEESFSKGTETLIPSAKTDSPPTSVLTNGTSSASVTPKEEGLRPKDNGNVLTKPVVSVNMEFEPKVVEQDIVDMYMKSMQQFTESLAKMKLPVSSENSSSSDQKSTASKNNDNGSRVFYGSRAFF